MKLARNFDVPVFYFFATWMEVESVSVARSNFLIFCGESSVYFSVFVFRNFVMGRFSNHNLVSLNFYFV